MTRRSRRGRKHAQRQTPTLDTPPRRLLTIPFGVPAYWTPEQALAVIELLDELRELIWGHYQIQLLDAFRQDLQPRSSDPSGSPPDDPPF